MADINAARAEALIRAAHELSSKVERLVFSPPVSHTYNPLTYAWEAHKQYLSRYGRSRKKVLFIGMNPGPFGMVQCGVPFGEISAVRDWLGIETRIAKPGIENPWRVIEGFACSRSEVSGRRLWGLFQERFGTAESFFTQHFVANYCPLAFFNQGRNLTPDKLPAGEAAPLNAACDGHLRQVVTALDTKWVIAVGGFAEQRAIRALAGMDVRIGKILHPSPASPAANRGWAAVATQQLMALGIWQ